MPARQNGQKHSNNSLARVDELLSVPDHLAGLALKGLIPILQEICKEVKMNHYVIIF